MGACSLRILTGAADLGRKYYTIPLSDKKAYSVANEVTGSEVFSIKAFMVDDKGTPTSQGATPSLIRQYLASDTCKSIKISSKAGTCYVNISLKEKIPSTVNKIASKVEPFVPIAPVVSMCTGFLKFCQAAEVFDESEVYFSITADKTDTTKFTFDGELTLLEIGQKAAQTKAFAVADKSAGHYAATLVGALCSATGGIFGGLFEESGDQMGQVVAMAVDAVGGHLLDAGRGG